MNPFILTLISLLATSAFLSAAPVNSAYAGSFTLRCQELLTAAKQVFTKPTLDEYVWLDHPLTAEHRGLIDAFGFQRKIPRGSTIRIIGPEVVEQVFADDHRGARNFLQGQEILRNTPYEMSFFEISTDVEVAHNRALMPDGTVVSGGLIPHGSRYSIPTDGSLAALNEFRARLRNRKPLLVEYTHTHPMFQYFSITPTGKALININPLSSTDLDSARWMSTEIFPGIHVRAKAVLPNGYHYRVTYLDGRLVTHEDSHAFGREPLQQKHGELEEAFELMDKVSLEEVLKMSQENVEKK